MAYNEQKDLIQNIKDLYAHVDELNESVSRVEPSIEDILRLRDEFENLSNSTLEVIKQYESTLDEKTDEFNTLLIDCKSQFKQVTNDVEALVQLQVNFDSIRDSIVRCLELSATLADLVQGPFILMEGESIPIKDRVPYKHYLKVTDSVAIGGTGGSDQPGIPSTVVVSPNMAISFDAP